MKVNFQILIGMCAKAHKGYRNENGRKGNTIEQVKKEELMHIVQNSVLFRNVDKKEAKSLLEHGRVKSCKKGGFVFEETDTPSKFYILIRGKITIFKDTAAGKRILITDIESAGEMFGEVYLFLECENYGMYAQAQEDSAVLELTKEIFENRTLQYNMMCIFAWKAYAMNRKIKILGGSDIRGKIVRYLFELQGADGKIRGELRREVMADYMNVARPSLSRELGRMQSEGILYIEGRKIEVINQEKFESYL